MRKRLSVGHLGFFVPTGKPVRLGTPVRRRLGDVEEYGTSRTITIVVGQNKGHQAHNRAGKCALAPGRFMAQSIDREFMDLREVQVGRKAIGATRTAGRGWFEGKPEASVTYEVSHIPNEREPSFATFKRNMDALAEKLAERTCQDSVLILRDDGGKKTVAAASWKPRKRK